MTALSASEIRQVTVSVVARFWDATLGGAPRDEAALADDLSLLVSALTPIPLAVSIGPVPEVSAPWVQLAIERTAEAASEVVSEMVTNVIAGAILAVRDVSRAWIDSDPTADVGAALRATVLGIARGEA